MTLSYLKTKRKLFKKLVKKLISKSSPNCIKATISISKILRGSEGDELTGLEYVLMTGDKFRTSTHISNGPQVKLLQDYIKNGNSVFDNGHFIKTDYYKNALQSIHYLGDYFPYCTTPDKIQMVAKRFIDSFLKKDISDYNGAGHNGINDPIIVRPIFNSDCYQLVSGNHRVAIAYVNGEKNIPVEIKQDEVTDTYFSYLVKKVIWDQGKELYQPIVLPEFANILLIRNCEDRFEKMTTFLKSTDLNLKNLSLLDIGSYYGWFVKKYMDIGIEPLGIERDFSACQVAINYHNLSDRTIKNITLEEFLYQDTKNFDIILFLSVLHHFILGKSYLNAEEVFKILAHRTKKIMFFEMGEEHEIMFNGALKGWNEDTIVSFIKKNSSFKEIIKLGRDEDNKGRFCKDYKRMLFALVK